MCSSVKKNENVYWINIFVVFKVCAVAIFGVVVARPGGGGGYEHYELAGYGGGGHEYGGGYELGGYEGNEIEGHGGDGHHHSEEFIDYHVSK